jgi:tRNA-modifying protein YgfZ
MPAALMPPRAKYMTMPPTPVACSHTGWGLLRASGDDAIAFLHGQLSSDVESLGPGDGQYWSYNSPKGRMLANGVLWRSPADEADVAITLLLADDLAETIRRRLSMFVLRARAKIEDDSARSALIGLAGGPDGDVSRAAFGIAPRPSCAVAFGDGATAFALPDGRSVIVAPAENAPMLRAAIARHASVVESGVWRWYGIAAGVPWITAATSDRFVPQAANWDLLGGVSFRKGCYPGQEIVARMQYLGRLKERLFAFHTAETGDVAPAARLYSATFDSTQACGTVVNAARAPSGGIALLAVVQTMAVEADDLTLDAPGGARLTRRPLPYAVPAVEAREARPRIG